MGELIHKGGWDPRNSLWSLGDRERGEMTRRAFVCSRGVSDHDGVLGGRGLYGARRSSETIQGVVKVASRWMEFVVVGGPDWQT